MNRQSAGEVKVDMRARIDGVVVAESDQTVLVEGNHYFPPDSVAAGVLTPTSTRTLCMWKGVARYQDATVDGTTHRNVAWVYGHPSPFARRIKAHVAFAPGVEVG